jgi:hypothetical protein
LLRGLAAAEQRVGLVMPLDVQRQSRDGRQDEAAVRRRRQRPASGSHCLLVLAESGVHTRQVAPSSRKHVVDWFEQPGFLRELEALVADAPCRIPANAR